MGPGVKGEKNIEKGPIKNLIEMEVLYEEVGIGEGDLGKDKLVPEI